MKKDFTKKEKEMIKKAQDLVVRKMEKENSNSTSIKYTGKNQVGGFGGVNEFVFAKGSDGFTVYQGCDLLVGDTTLFNCIVVMMIVCGIFGND